MELWFLHLFEERRVCFPRQKGNLVPLGERPYYETAIPNHWVNKYSCKEFLSFVIVYYVIGLYGDTRLDASRLKAGSHLNKCTDSAEAAQVDARVERD